MFGIITTSVASAISAAEIGLSNPRFFASIYPTSGAISRELMLSVPFTISVPQYCAFVNASPDRIHKKIVLFTRTARPARMYSGMIVANASLKDLRWISFPIFDAIMVNLSTNLEFSKDIAFMVTPPKPFSFLKSFPKLF